MPSLRDISKYREEVELGGVEFPVRGVSLEFIVDLVDRFEPVKVLFGMGLEAIDPLTIIRQAPDAARAAMLQGLDKAGDPDEEEELKSLALVDQVTIMEAVFRATFGGDLDPFVRRVQRLFGLREASIAAAAPNGLAPDSSSLSPQTL